MADSDDELPGNPYLGVLDDPEGDPWADPDALLPGARGPRSRVGYGNARAHDKRSDEERTSMHRPGDQRRDHVHDPWNRNYPPGVRCEPCSGRSPVPVFHPADRPHALGLGHVEAES